MKFFERLEKVMVLFFQPIAHFTKKWGCILNTLAPFFKTMTRFFKIKGRLLQLIEGLAEYIFRFIL